MRYDLLVDIAEEAELGTRGTDIFVHHMDFDAKNGILIRGPLQGIPVDHYLPGYYTAKIQVIVRNIDQQTGDAIMKRVTKVFTIHRRTFTDDSQVFQMEIKQMIPSTLPVIYPRSTAQEIEWSLTFDTTYVVPVE